MLKVSMIKHALFARSECRVLRPRLTFCAALLASVTFISQASAAVLYTEDFSTAPANLSSGKWNSAITDGAVPVAGTWNVASSIAGSVNAGSGTRQANAQFSFDGADLTGFGALFDAGSNTVGGGNVAGTLYLRFDVQILHPNPADLSPHFGGLQLHRGTTSNRADMDQYTTQGALLLGKQWGRAAYSYTVNGAVNGDLNAIGAPDPAPYAFIDTNWHTVVARINYNAAAADSATVWFDPDFNLTEAGQDAAVTTALSTGAGNYSFNTFVLRAGNNGMTINFADIVFATDPTDVGFAPVPEPTALVLAAVSALGCIVVRGRGRRRTSITASF